MLPDLIKYAEYNNWGNPKATDGPNIIGYLNFKCKCMIDGKKENIRLAVQFQKGGKYYYNIEINKKKAHTWKEQSLTLSAVWTFKSPAM